MNEREKKLLENTEFRKSLIKAEKELPERLRRLRKANGCTLEEIEDDTGVPYCMVARYERGENTPTLYVLVVLADYYGVSLDWLCGRDAHNG